MVLLAGLVALSRESFASLSYLVRETHADRARARGLPRSQRDSMGSLARRRSSRFVGAPARNGVDCRGESAAA